MKWLEDIVDRLKLFGLMAGSFILGWVMHGWWLELTK